MDVLGAGLGRFDDLPCPAVECNILDLGRLRALVGDFRPQRVYHLAALVHPGESKQRPRDYYEVNVQGTVNLLEALRISGSGARTLLVSSAEVYGNASSDQPIAEYAPIHPANPYASSKRISEEVAAQYSQLFGLETVVVRPFNHSGPGQAEGFVISDFCKQIAAIEGGLPGLGNTMRVGNLKPVRDFLDVRDVVQSYTRLLEKAPGGQVYNLCSGIGTRIQEILDIALSLSPARIEAVVSPDKHRPSGETRLVGDNRKLRQLLDWTPRYTLRQTIAETLDYWRNRLHDRANG